VLSCCKVSKGRSCIDINMHLLWWICLYDVWSWVWMFTWSSDCHDECYGFYMYVVWLFIALWIDICFRLNDTMLYVRCTLACVWVRIQVLNLFLIRLRHKTQWSKANLRVGRSWVPNTFLRAYLNSEPIPQVVRLMFIPEEVYIWFLDHCKN